MRYFICVILFFMLSVNASSKTQLNLSTIDDLTLCLGPEGELSVGDFNRADAAINRGLNIKQLAAKPIISYAYEAITRGLDWSKCQKLVESENKNESYTDTQVATNSEPNSEPTNSQVTSSSSSNKYSSYSTEQLCKVATRKGSGGQHQILWASVYTSGHVAKPEAVNEAKRRNLKLRDCAKYVDNNTQVASTSEPTTTQVVQVPESKVNKEAPVLDIEDRITVTERNYSISGQISDESEVFVEVNNNSIIVSNNTFTIQRYAPIGIQELEIIATDEWGNETKKIIIVERIMKTASSTNSLEELNPNKLQSKHNKNRIALVIGIEEYKNISSANFAKRDAEYFIDYAQGGFGIPDSNIKYFFNENANMGLRFDIKDWLKKNVRNDTEVYIYFCQIC